VIAVPDSVGRVDEIEEKLVAVLGRLEQVLNDEWEILGNTVVALQIPDLVVQSLG
jgi:hypothetical protein